MPKIQTFLTIVTTFLCVLAVFSAPAFAGGNLHVFDNGDLQVDDRVCTSPGSPRELNYTPDLGRATTEGVFDCAVWNGNHWTADVEIDNKGTTLYRDLEVCALVSYGRNRDLYCAIETTRSGGVKHDKYRRENKSAGNQRRSGELCSLETPEDNDVKRKPGGWQGIFKCADRQGSTWEATLYGGGTLDGYKQCKLFEDKFLICQ